MKRGRTYHHYTMSMMFARNLYSVCTIIKYKPKNLLKPLAKKVYTEVAYVEMKLCES